MVIRKLIEEATPHMTSPTKDAVAVAGAIVTTSITVADVNGAIAMAVGVATLVFIVMGCVIRWRILMGRGRRNDAGDA